MYGDQKTKLHIDQKNLVPDTLGMSSDRIYRWRLILEEYSLEIICIKGIDDTVAAALLRLSYNPEKNPKNTFCRVLLIAIWLRY